MENDIPYNPDITYFGKTNYRGKEQVFGIKRKDRRQHMYILGKSGTGKSAMLKNMIIQNIRNGEGLAVVDPHGELAEEVLELIPEHRKGDVVYFNPADTDFHIGFNILEVSDPKYKHLIAGGLMSVFTKIWSNVWSARMEYIMNNAILALIDTPGSTLLGIPRLLVDKNYRQGIVNNIKDPVVKAFWTTEYESWQERFRNEAIAPIQNKVGQFLSTSITRNIVGQSKSTINIFELMNSKKILIVNVSKGRIGEDNSALLGAMFITKIQLAAMERVRIPEQDREDFYLYVDEFQNFVTDAFAGILSEARKYRLNLCVAHQYIAQLSTAESTAVRDAVFGNVGSMVIFRIGGADAEFIEQEFTPELTAQDFVNLPNYQIYLRLMVDGVTSRPFSAGTLQPLRVDGSRTIAQQIIESSRKNYTVAREIVEKEIQNWTTGDVSEDDDKSSNEIRADKDGMYRVRCSMHECNNIALVPFKPEKGRPVYCKEHVEKIKSGEIEPLRVRPHHNKTAQQTLSSLSKLGIGIQESEKEFTEKKQSSFQKQPRKSFSPEHRKPVSLDKKNSSFESPLKKLLATVGKESPENSSPSQKKTEQPLSLSSLRTTKPTPSEQTKIAKDTSRNALSEALANITKKESLDYLQTVAQQKNNPEQSPAPFTQDTQDDFLKKIEEKNIQHIQEQKKIIDQEQSNNLHAKLHDAFVTEKMAQELLEKKRKEIDVSAPEKQSPVIKEIPEDVLRKILD